ncbi:MAG: hypothetical protein IJL85_02105 [Erysipelotrichaceae bacterium]|nr:hypothetical protein [Erysipelotrichaceae bacterium]
MNGLMVYLKPLLLTILFEMIAAYIMGLRTKKELLLTILVNIITNPLLVYFSLILMYHLGIKTGTILTYAILEPLVIYVEYLIYISCLSDRNCLFLSIVLNLVSIIGGLLCQRII